MNVLASNCAPRVGQPDRHVVHELRARSPVLAAKRLQLRRHRRPSRVGGPARSSSARAATPVRRAAGQTASARTKSGSGAGMHGSPQARGLQQLVPSEQVADHLVRHARAAGTTTVTNGARGTCDWIGPRHSNSSTRPRAARPSIAGNCRARVVRRSSSALIRVMPSARTPRRDRTPRGPVAENVHAPGCARRHGPPAAIPMEATDHHFFRDRPGQAQFSRPGNPRGTGAVVR